MTVEIILLFEKFLNSLDGGYRKEISLTTCLSNSMMNSYVSFHTAIVCIDLTLSMLGNYFSRRHFEMFFLIIPSKYALTFHANCLLGETICMKCQSIFSGKNKKKISAICRLLNLFRIKLPGPLKTFCYCFLFCRMFIVRFLFFNTKNNLIQ